jgi:hypothetical protein
MTPATRSRAGRAAQALDRTTMGKCGDPRDSSPIRRFRRRMAEAPPPPCRQAADEHHATFLVETFAYMVDHIVDMTKPRGNVDIQVGVVRRCRWSDEVRGCGSSRNPVRRRRRIRGDALARHFTPACVRLAASSRPRPGMVVRAARGCRACVVAGCAAGCEGSDMVAPASGVKVLVGTRPVDFRKRRRRGSARQDAARRGHEIKRSMLTLR